MDFEQDRADDVTELAKRLMTIEGRASIYGLERKPNESDAELNARIKAASLFGGSDAD